MITALLIPVDLDLELRDERKKTPLSHRVNQKDKFYHNAKTVISCIAQIKLSDDSIDAMAIKCLSVYSNLKENESAFEKIATIKLEYLILALLYLFKDGITTAAGTQIVPQIVEVQSLLPSICDIHKYTYDARKRVSKKVKKVGNQKQIGVRKKTLTNTSRQLVNALRCLVR